MYSTKNIFENGRFESDFVCLENLIIELNELISSTKVLYNDNLGKKLNNPFLQAKTYWSILRTFCNDKKIPLITSLLVDDKHLTDIKTKANIFNEYFAEQCILLLNSSDTLNQTLIKHS